MPLDDHPFPLPWIVKEITGGYTVLDARGTSLAHFYARPGNGPGHVTRENARLLAHHFARLPGLIAAEASPGRGRPEAQDLAWWNGSLAQG